MIAFRPTRSRARRVKPPIPTEAVTPFFADNFAGGVLHSTSGFTWDLTGTIWSVSSDYAFAGGTHSLKGTYIATALGEGTNQGTGNINFSINRPNLHEFWLEWQVYIPANYYHRNNYLPGTPAVGVSDNNKFLSMWADDYGGTQQKLTFGTLPNPVPTTVTASVSGQSQAQMFIRRSDEPAFTAVVGHDTFIGSTVPYLAQIGQTNTMRVHYRRESAFGVGDGEVAWWVNGTLMRRIRGRIGSPDSSQFNQGFTNGYFFGACNSGFAEPTTFYLGAVKLYDQDPHWEAAGWVRVNRVIGSTSDGTVSGSGASTYVYGNMLRFPNDLYPQLTGISFRRPATGSARNVRFAVYQGDRAQADPAGADLVVDTGAVSVPASGSDAWQLQTLATPVPLQADTPLWALTKGSDGGYVQRITELDSWYSWRQLYSGVPGAIDHATAFPTTLSYTSVLGVDLIAAMRLHYTALDETAAPPMVISKLHVTAATIEQGQSFDLGVLLRWVNLTAGDAVTVSVLGLPNGGVTATFPDGATVTYGAPLATIRFTATESATLQTNKVTVLVTQTNGDVTAHVLQLTTVTPSMTAPYYATGFDSNSKPSAGGLSWNSGVPLLAGGRSTGGYALHFDFPGTDPATDSSREQRVQLASTAGYSQLGIEYWIKLPTNFRHRAPGGSDNNKFLVVWRDVYSNITDGDYNLAIEYTRFSDDVSVLRPMNRSEDNGVDTVTTIKGPGGAGRPLISPRGPLVRGLWQRVRFFVSASTAAGVRDGVFKLWIGDTLVYSREDLLAWNYPKPTAQPDVLFRNMYFLGWANTGFAEATDILIDDVKFYNTKPQGWY